MAPGTGRYRERERKSNSQDEERKGRERESNSQVKRKIQRREALKKKREVQACVNVTEKGEGKGGRESEMEGKCVEEGEKRTSKSNKQI